MCYCDTEGSPEFYRERIHIARKWHRCCECGSIIDPGEKYFYVTGLWDGDFSTYKTCEICQKIKQEAISSGHRCILFECLYETVGSEFDYVINGV